MDILILLCFGPIFFTIAAYALLPFTIEAGKIIECYIELWEKFELTRIKLRKRDETDI